MMHDLEQLSREAGEELEDALAFWIRYTVDEEHGGFAGSVSHTNQQRPGAPKGSVLNSRILYAFSSAYHLTAKPEYMVMASRAFQYLMDHFIDKKYGGVYWTVSFDGHPLDTKKQIYAQAFAIYGLSEYYAACKEPEALNAALRLYEDIIQHSYDLLNGGYTEAFAQDWQPLGDLRLSDKDVNEKKSMNTHLHILEAFANLYRVHPDPLLQMRIRALILNFQDHIIHPVHHHLILFFNEQWHPRSETISYGHDIEAAWLLQEAAEVAGLEEVLGGLKKISVQLAEAASQAIDQDGGLWYEYEPATKHLVKEKHWWPQAEAIVGFFNAWQITGNGKFLDYCLGNWQFIRQHIIDHRNGEWYWGVYEDYSVMDTHDKAGVWKCPYHNSRACMEIIKRIAANGLAKDKQ